MGTGKVIIVDTDTQRRARIAEWLREQDYEVTDAAFAGAETPLRERAPEIYQAALARYEEAVKQVLQHRIYKMNDDVFEPFRQIAKQLFLANATARDAVELHYQTLRKIAPTPESPRAQAYLEVGRTTIVGLMGDLLNYYRNACVHPALEEQEGSFSNGGKESSK
jgi:hypothetical protein